MSIRNRLLGGGYQPTGASAQRKPPTGVVSGLTVVVVEPKGVLPADAEGRKAVPLCSGVLDYFPSALVYLARISKAGNDQHNPGQPLHWARGKSMDHADCLLRHLAQRGTVDTDGLRHAGKMAWRALALLQEELEREEGAPVPRGASFDSK